MHFTAQKQRFATKETAKRTPIYNKEDEKIRHTLPKAFNPILN